PSPTLSLHSSLIPSAHGLPPPLNHMVNSRNSIKAWNVASFELMNLPRASAAIMNSLLLDVACCMKQGSGPVEPVVDRTGKVPPEPRFVVDLEPWTRVFFHNLSDLFRTPQP